MFKRKKRYIAVFLVREQQTYTVLFNKRFSPSNKSVRFKKSTFPLKIDFPTYSKRLNLYYFIDISKGQLIFDKNDNMMNSETIDMILSQNIITQLTDDLLGSNFKMNLFNMLIGAIIGGLIGWIAGGMAVV